VPLLRNTLPPYNTLLQQSVPHLRHAPLPHSTLLLRNTPHPQSVLPPYNTLLQQSVPHRHSTPHRRHMQLPHPRRSQSQGACNSGGFFLTHKGPRSPVGLCAFQCCQANL